MWHVLDSNVKARYLENGPLDIKFKLHFDTQILMRPATYISTVSKSELLNIHFQHEPVSEAWGTGIYFYVFDIEFCVISYT